MIIVQYDHINKTDIIDRRKKTNNLFNVVWWESKRHNTSSLFEPSTIPASIHIDTYFQSKQAVIKQHNHINVIIFYTPFLCKYLFIVSIHSHHTSHSRGSSFSSSISPSSWSLLCLLSKVMFAVMLVSCEKNLNKINKKKSFLKKSFSIFIYLWFHAEIEKQFNIKLS